MGKRSDDEYGDAPGLTQAQRLLRKKMTEAKSRSKYNNVRVRWKDMWFDSIYEMEAAKKLDAMRRAVGKKDRVVDVQYQVRFMLSIHRVKICEYIADFVVEFADGRVDVIDAKGVRTSVYRLKQKMMRAIYGIEIVEM